MSHLILLGDSIFDNAAYTNGGPDVVTQLNDLLPAGWAASLLAIDGSTTDDIAGQVGRLPSDASHLVLSVGGNDALQQTHLLFTPAASTEEALGLLADLAEQFEHDYRAAVQACLRPGPPLTVCTIYNGNFPDPAYQRLVLGCAGPKPGGIVAHGQDGADDGNQRPNAVRLSRTNRRTSVMRSLIISQLAFRAMTCHPTTSQ